MIRDIYCRSLSDKFKNDSILEHHDIYEEVRSKIMLILSTPKGSVLGDPDFGMNLEEYIFETSISAATIENEFYKQVSMYVPEYSKFDIKMSVNFVKGETYDTAVVDVKIDGDKAVTIAVG